MTYEQMHEVAQYLYKLLDDIDTAGDMAKSDDKLYRSIVERTQSKKGLVVDKCDGYTVQFKPSPNKLLFSLLGSEHVFEIINKALDNYKALTPEQIAALKKRFDEIG